MKTRKELPKTALPRIYFIDRQIASGSYPNSRILAKAFETSESTINRDIEFMRTMLNAPIVFDHVHNGYYYAEKTWRLSAGYATAEEMLALGLVKNLVSLYRKTPFYETARQLLEIIGAPLAAASAEAKNPHWHEDRIVVPRLAAAPVEEKLWQVAVKALRENRVITFDYTGTWDEEPRNRRVRPWQLLFDSGAWFLSAWDEDRAASRIFSLARMENAALTEETFPLPRDYDYRHTNGDSYFGVFKGTEQKRCRINFYEEAVVWARERQWAADQRIEEFTEKGKTCVTLEFTSGQYEKVLEWVLSRGGNALPLEPPELVADWSGHIETMWQRIGAERAKTKPAKRRGLAPGDKPPPVS
jgi:predicted DNA-binding transcriptional regulator YafY